MRIWPRTLTARLLLALLVSLLAVAVLAIVVESFEVEKPPLRRPGGDLDPSQTPAGATIINLAEMQRQQAGDSGLRLHSVRGSIALVRRSESLSPDVAPVLEVLADGQAVLRRSPPISQRPDGLPPLSTEGYGAGIVLGVTDLARLSPTARRTLVFVIGELATERPIAAGRVRTIDFRTEPEQLRRLLSWVR